MHEYRTVDVRRYIREHPLQKETAALPAQINIIRDLPITDQTSQNGRFLSEGGAPVDTISTAEQRGIQMRLATCPYSGSRHGAEMEVDAIREIRRNWPSVLDGFAWANLQYFGDETPQEPILEDLFYTLKPLICLPEYLFNRGQNPIYPYGALPNEVADIYKASLGIQLTVFDMGRNLDPKMPITSNIIFQYAEENNLLHGETGLVCAAPEPMIRQALDVLLTRKEGNSKRSVLSHLVPDMEHLRNFGDVYDICHDLFTNLGRSTQELNNAIMDILKAKPAHQRTMADVRRIHVIAKQFANMETDALISFNKLQPLINFTLGREFQDSLHLTHEDISGAYEVTPRVIVDEFGMPFEEFLSIAK